MFIFRHHSDPYFPYLEEIYPYFPLFATCQFCWLLIIIIIPILGSAVFTEESLLSRIWKSRSNFVGKCLDKCLHEIPYLLLLVDLQFWLFHVRILNAFKYIIFSNHGGPFKCIPNHFRQEFNSNLPPREPLLFGTALRAIVLDIDKTSYSLSSDFTIKWNHVSDSCLRKAENLYIFVRFPYFYENIPYLRHILIDHIPILHWKFALWCLYI